MAAKEKPDLNALLANAGGSTRRRSMPVEPALVPHDGVSAKTVTQLSRERTAAITAHFPEDVRAQLKILAVEKRRTMQGLIAEAFNDLFSKYGKPEIAPVDNGTSG